MAFLKMAVSREYHLSKIFCYAGVCVCAIECVYVGTVVVQVGEVNPFVDMKDLEAIHFIIPLNKH